MHPRLLCKTVEQQNHVMIVDTAPTAVNRVYKFRIFSHWNRLISSHFFLNLGDSISTLITMNPSQLSVVLAAGLCLLSCIRAAPLASHVSGEDHASSHEIQERKVDSVEMLSGNDISTQVCASVKVPAQQMVFCFALHTLLTEHDLLILHDNALVVQYISHKQFLLSFYFQVQSIYILIIKNYLSYII